MNSYKKMIELLGTTSPICYKPFASFTFTPEFSTSSFFHISSCSWTWSLELGPCLVDEVGSHKRKERTQMKKLEDLGLYVEQLNRLISNQINWFINENQ